MPKVEENLVKNEAPENRNEQKLNLAESVDGKTAELKKLTDWSGYTESVFDNTESSWIRNEEEKEIKDWQQTAQEIISSDENAAVNESWLQAAEDRFGIKNFDLQSFKRVVYNKEMVNQNFAAGYDWNFILDHEESFIDGESYEAAAKAFEVMDELETEVPGSVRLLNEKFGIANFQRYPKEILLKQLQEIDQEKEVGLLVFAKGDWNGAFDNQSKIWNKLYEQKKDKLNFRIIECDTKNSLAKGLLQTKNEFNNKIALAFLSAHSSPEGFDLANDGNEAGYVSKENITETTSKMKDLFAPRAQVIANACSSGALAGWVEGLSKESRISAVGPDRPAGISDIDFAGEEVVPEYYDTDIYSKYQNGFLLSKKRAKKI
jgi:hypothetical protein